MVQNSDEVSGPAADLAWLQQQFRAAGLNVELAQDTEDDAGAWTDPTDGVLSEILECCEMGKFEELQELLNGNPDIDVNAAGPDGDTALHIACLYGHLDCVKALLEKGAFADTVNTEDGSTALHDACAGGYLQIAELVLAKAPETVSLADEDGDTPLHNAARGNHLEVVKLLLAAGANTSAKNHEDNTPAEEAEEEEVIAVLREAAAAAKS
mmetsp:Transcript_37518/g.83507  ORF Transcript_37518/g.83507 Transcript_37518/m.83507 type:complete len:211 (+) Transcript_37518:173-805(+)